MTEARRVHSFAEISGASSEKLRHFLFNIPADSDSFPSKSPQGKANCIITCEIILDLHAACLHGGLLSAARIHKCRAKLAFTR